MELAAVAQQREDDRVGMLTDQERVGGSQQRMGIDQNKIIFLPELIEKLLSAALGQGAEHVSIPMPGGQDSQALLDLLDSSSHVHFAAQRLAKSRFYGYVEEALHGRSPQIAVNQKRPASGAGEALGQVAY